MLNNFSRYFKHVIQVYQNNIVTPFLTSFSCYTCAIQRIVADG